MRVRKISKRVNLQLERSEVSNPSRRGSEVQILNFPSLTSRRTKEVNLRISEVLETAKNGLIKINGFGNDLFRGERPPVINYGKVLSGRVEGLVEGLRV